MLLRRESNPLSPGDLDIFVTTLVYHNSEGDYGLFVTLSNYTKNAQKYLDSTPIIRGIKGTELVDLVLKYYDLLDDTYKKMIPLKMGYVPVLNQEWQG